MQVHRRSQERMPRLEWSRQLLRWGLQLAPRPWTRWAHAHPRTKWKQPHNLRAPTTMPSMYAVLQPALCARAAARRGSPPRRSAAAAANSSSPSLPHASAAPRDTLLGHVTGSGAPPQQQQRGAAVWQELQDVVLRDARAAVTAAFPALRPVRTRFSDADAPDGHVSFRSADGDVAGEVVTLRGGGVAWSVGARFWSTSRGFGAMRFDAYLDDATASPHLLLHLNVLPDSVLFYFNCAPRVDLVMHDEYLQKTYETPPPGQSRALAELAAECLNDPALQAYQSRDAVTRAHMAPPAALLFTAAADAAGVARVRDIAEEMTRTWVALATQPVVARPADDAPLRARDAVLRNFVKRDPDTQARAATRGDAASLHLLSMLTRLCAAPPLAHAAEHGADPGRGDDAHAVRAAGRDGPGAAAADASLGASFLRCCHTRRRAACCHLLGRAWQPRGRHARPAAAHCCGTNG
jgi:hypothetical protein